MEKTNKSSSKPLPKLPKENANYTSRECNVNEDVKVNLKAGAVASDIILPHEYATIKVKFPTSNFRILIDSGKIKGISNVISKPEKKVEIVSFNSSKDAEFAYVQMESANIGKVIPKKQERDTSVIIKWTEGKLIEIVIKFKSPEACLNFTNSCDSSLVDGTKTRLVFKIAYSKYEGVRDFKNPQKFLVRKGFKSSDKIGFYEELFKTNIQNIDEVSGRYLDTTIDDTKTKDKMALILAPNDIEWKETVHTLKFMKEVKNKSGQIIKSGYYSCLVKPKTNGDLLKILALNDRTFGDRILQVSEQSKNDIMININIYRAIRKYLLEFLKTLKSWYPNIHIINYAEEPSDKKMNIKISETETIFPSFSKIEEKSWLGENTSKIIISGKYQKEVAKASHDLYFYIKGYPVFIDYIDNHILKSPHIQKELLQIEKTFSVKLLSTAPNIMQIFSTSRTPFEAEKIIYSLLTKEKSDRYIEFRIKNKRGVEELKKDLKTKYSVIVFFDYRTCVLKILIDREKIGKFEEIKQYLNSFNEKNSAESKENLKNQKGDCIICLCEMLPSDLIYLTKSCGHKMHNECYRIFLSNALQPDQDLPLTCPECKQVLSLADLRFSQTEFMHLSEKSLTKLINENNKSFGYCGVKNCWVPLRKDPNLNECWSCNTKLCNLCMKKAHPGLSCEHALLNIDPKLVKTCPGCGILIEKAEGCNHIVCHACKVHFCWKCGIFKSPMSNQVYEHMREMHGGISD